MSKRIGLLLIIILVFPLITYSNTLFVIQETEKISLEANAIDPDADKLTIRYSAPLNENGEWQTSYGDAGEYKVTVTASDGITDVAREILIVVKKKEESPKIESFAPKDAMIKIKEAESIDFRVLASDLNKDELRYSWFLDGKKVNDGQEFSYDASYKDEGSHSVSVIVSDGATNTSMQWSVDVANVDVESLFEQIKDVAVDENEIVSLSIPDFEKYKLVYSISEPIGNENEWKTGYEDAGSYDVTVRAEGKGFSEEKIVKVTVNDVDRAPVFEKIPNRFLNENEELKIVLNANDPDGDKVDFSISNLPEGAKLEGDVFIWEPSYDIVRKEGFVDRLMDKFRVLSKSFYVQFVASSKDKKVVQNIIITVKDANRAPVIEDMEPITISEGETLKISPNSYDLDRDKISLRYSGFIDTNTFKSGFDDAGTYYVKVTASDGLLEASKFVQIDIKQTNRAPMFTKIEDVTAREGDTIAVLLNAHDPDGDEISYSIDNPPEGYSLKGNSFTWNVPFNAADKKEAKKFDLVFAASDGKEEIRQIAKFEIADKNRAPKIINASKSIVANVNKPVLMFVKAVDEDNDDLFYTWDFGLLEKYKATSHHQRTFTSKGAKAVKVIVSDGVDEVEQVINVNVI